VHYYIGCRTGTNVIVQIGVGSSTAARVRRRAVRKARSSHPPRRDVKGRRISTPLPE
jgi:hypothetical protein